MCLKLENSEYDSISHGKWQQTYTCLLVGMGLKQCVHWCMKAKSEKIKKEVLKILEGFWNEIAIEINQAFHVQEAIADV